MGIWGLGSETQGWLGEMAGINWRCVAGYAVSVYIDGCGWEGLIDVGQRWRGWEWL